MKENYERAIAGPIATGGAVESLQVQVLDGQFHCCDPFLGAGICFQKSMSILRPGFFMGLRTWVPEK